MVPSDFASHISAAPYGVYKCMCLSLVTPAMKLEQFFQKHVGAETGSGQSNGGADGFFLGVGNAGDIGEGGDAPNSAALVSLKT